MALLYSNDLIQSFNNHKKEEKIKYRLIDMCSKCTADFLNGFAIDLKIINIRIENKIKIIELGCEHYTI